MNKKLQSTLVMVGIAGSLLCSTIAFAEQDYRERNIFNHISDGFATMFKSPDLKQSIIDERVNLREERRKISAHMNDKNSDVVKNYNGSMDKINIKDAREKYEHDRKAAMDDWQRKADQTKRDLKNERDQDKRRINDEKAEENRNYDKQKMDITLQYRDTPDIRNAKLQEAEANHQAKMQDLDDQARTNPSRYEAKLKDLNASLDQEKANLERSYDERKQQLR